MDARNPYFFYSADLEKYIQEVGGNKQFMLLINKSDYLSEELRQHWSDYFKEKKVNHIFFSALLEQEVLDNTEDDVVEEHVESEDEEDNESSDNEDGDENKIESTDDVKRVEEQQHE